MTNEAPLIWHCVLVCVVVRVCPKAMQFVLPEKFCGLEQPASSSTIPVCVRHKGGPGHLCYIYRGFCARKRALSLIPYA